MSILLKLENSTNTWQSLEIILKGFILACTKHLRYTVNSVAPSKFWFLIRSPPAIDLRIYPHLRLLRFSLHIEKETIRTFPEYVIDWCSSIFESVTSNSLVVELAGFPRDVKSCDMIQNSLLSLNARLETFSVYSPRTMDIENKERLFSRLYEAGIVVYGFISPAQAVRRYFFALGLLP